jgi:hypothetical protein
MKSPPLIRAAATFIVIRSRVLLLWVLYCLGLIVTGGTLRPATMTLAGLD